VTLANLTACGTVRLTLELTPAAAAALKRFAEKISFEQASSVLYGHVKADLRSEQASEIVAAFGVLDTALADADVSSWPWIDTGRP
jgi:hypothetical protein